MPHAPRIDTLDPAAVLPGGEVRVLGYGLSANSRLPAVRMGGLSAAVLISSERLLVARVPEAAVSGLVEVEAGGRASVHSRQALEVGVLIAENLHPVCNPVLDAEGNIYATLSGARGQKTPVSVFRLDANYTLKPWSTAVMNPSGMAFDRQGVLYVTSRFDGTLYRLASNGEAAVAAQGLGTATGIAFDAAGNLYVGDRSGTIFKIDAQGKIFVFATLEASVAAYHLAFGPDRHLYVTGPSTSSHDTIWRISPQGALAPFFEGLGRPQGLAFDSEGNLYAVASHAGRRGVIRISPRQEAECVISGNNLVGLAFAPGQRRGPLPAALILATHTCLYHLPWPVAGAQLPPQVE
ncbi:MAG: SMP-30/gluconolactonase/LRE family protein [Terriglobales bacterium]